MDSLNNLTDMPFKQAQLDAQLSLAAQDGLADLVTDLIHAGANVNAKEKNDSFTPLRWAALRGHPATISVLINAHANVEEITFGRTALMIAAEEGNTACVSALIAHGANVNAANEFGETVLMFAAKKGATAIVSDLIVHGANVNAVNKWGESALKFAIRTNNETAFRLLNAMSPQEISATRPTPSFTYRLMRRPPAITPIEAAYKQALTEVRQSLSNVFGAFNEDANRHNLGTANVLMNIIAGYYAPNWCGNPNQEMNLVLEPRRKPVILSCTSRAMNLLTSTLTSLTNVIIPTVARVTEEPAVEQGVRKKARRD